MNIKRIDFYCEENGEFRMKKKIKIAAFVHGLSGGAGQIILNYYDHIPQDDYQIDIITLNVESEHLKEKFEKRNLKVLKIPSKKESLIKNIFSMYYILKNKDYDIVHAHMTLTNVFPLFVAWICGVKVRISHSHLSYKKSTYTRVLSNLTKLFATDYFACGKEAGNFLYGNSKFKILNNAIDMRQFHFDEEVRSSERKKLNIDKDTIVIGNVGRFSEQKNHKFIINVFRKVVEIHENSKLLLIGEGELFTDIKKYVDQLNLTKNVIFLGSIDDVDRKYQIMDSFLLPSLYEGLSLAAIEAQATGLPCIFSDKVALETSKTDKNSFLKFSDSLEKWAKQCVECSRTKRKDFSDLISDEGYNIAFEAAKLDAYLKKRVKPN